MVCRTVRNFVQQSCSLGATSMSFAFTKMAMKAPKAVMAPAGIVGSKLQDGFKMCPVLGSLDVTSMPVVGPFVAGVRAAQVAGAAVSALESTTAPFASVGAGIEAPIGIGVVAIAPVGAVREAEDRELIAIKDRLGSSMGKRQRMPLPDWF